MIFYVHPNVAKAGGHQRPRRRDLHFVSTRRKGCSHFTSIPLQRRIWSPPAFPTCWVVARRAKPKGETTWQNRSHPSISPMKVSKNLPCCYDIGYNCRPLSNLCHVVYATKGFILFVWCLIQLEISFWMNDKTTSWVLKISGHDQK